MVYRADSSSIHGLSSSLYVLEEAILSHVAVIEAWFRKQWQETPPSITTSVDLRHAGFKLAPVDTNLFPAGFNNIKTDFLPLCIQAMQAFLSQYYPSCTKLLIVPENHSRNAFYWQSLHLLIEILTSAGFVVQVGSFEPSISTPTPFKTEDKREVWVHPLRRQGRRLMTNDFNPCVILLNNDLSSGIPPLLEDVEQPIIPPPALGWYSRLKSTHFHYYRQVTSAFAELIGIQPWSITPLFRAVSGVDFMAQQGVEEVARVVDELIEDIAVEYQCLGIKQRPFVAVKADNGTYGMSVMMVKSGEEIRQLNRKQRTRMAVSKGSQQVTRLIIQEGVYSFETHDKGAAEPVVYMMGPYVVGGFYRVHQARGENDNLNAPGMHFAPIPFAKPCNVPTESTPAQSCFNRFYVYGVIARLAALAGAKEIAACSSKEK